MKINVLEMYILILVIFNLLIWATPFIYQTFENPLIYSIFSPFCHQITQRSLCMYENTIGDCYDQTIMYNNLTTKIFVENSQGIGYKLPVCARDVSFFLFMLIGGMIIYLYKGKPYSYVPPLWVFILFITPLAIDGITQILGIRQSNNILRIITGMLAGFIMPFFLIGLLNKKNESNKKIHVKRKSTKKTKR